jgi:hypothetical protein
MLNTDINDHVPKAGATYEMAGVFKSETVMYTMRTLNCDCQPMEFTALAHERSTNWMDDRIREVRKKGLTTLDLSAEYKQAQQSQVLPPGLFQLRDLKTLKLQHLNLTELPAEVYMLSNLEELEIYQFHPISLPDSLDQLVKLRKLTLTVELGEGPVRLPLPPHLKELDISVSSLNELPSIIGRLKELEVRTFGVNTEAVDWDLLDGLPALKELSVTFHGDASNP